METTDFLPGKIIQLHFEPESIGCEPAPYWCQIVTINKGMLTVHEVDSCNGLAKVQINGASNNFGRYWYSYKNLENKPESRDIVSMEDTCGNRLLFESFIKG